MSAPAILIRLELEAAPIVCVDALHQSEHERLVDWLEQHPRWLDLVQQAIELSEEARAA